MKESTVEIGSERYTLLYEFYGVQKFIKSRVRSLAWYIFVGCKLKIESSGSVRARLQKIGELIQLGDVYLFSSHAELAINDYAPTPCVWCSVTDAAGHP